MGRISFAQVDDGDVGSGEAGPATVRARALCLLWGSPSPSWSRAAAAPTSSPRRRARRPSPRLPRLSRRVVRTSSCRAGGSRSGATSTPRRHTERSSRSIPMGAMRGSSPIRPSGMWTTIPTGRPTASGSPLSAVRRASRARCSRSTPTAAARRRLRRAASWDRSAISRSGVDTRRATARHARPRPRTRGTGARRALDPAVRRRAARPRYRPPADDRRARRLDRRR